MMMKKKEERVSEKRDFSLDVGEEKQEEGRESGKGKERKGKKSVRSS